MLKNLIFSLMLIPSSWSTDLPEKLHYVPFQEVGPGQPYVSDAVINSIQKTPRPDKEGRLGWPKRPEDPRVFDFDNGRSPFGSPVRVIKIYPIKEMGGKSYLLVDGHHSLIGRLHAIRKLGFNPELISIPITVIMDYTDLKFLSKSTPAKKEDYPLINMLALNDARKRGFIYDRDFSGNPVPLPRDFLNIPNDSMRSLIETTTINVSENWGPEPLNKNPELSLWIRVGGASHHRDIDFVEFHMAQALYRANFVYTDGDEITEELLSRVRDILIGHPITKEKRIKILVRDSQQPACLILATPEHFGFHPNEKVTPHRFQEWVKDSTDGVSS